MSRRPLVTALFGGGLVRAVLLAPLTLAIADVADAAETGDIRGRVVDDTGNPVGGAELTLSGPLLAGELTSTTGADGQFRFVNIPPGDHDLLIVAEGYAPVRAPVSVRLGEATFVPVQLRKATGEANETIVVEGALPVVDATKSSFNAELGDELLQNLPVGRSYQSAVNMLPGVYGRVDTQAGGPGTGNPSVRGEGQYGNNYEIDGVSTRDPATNTFGSNVNFDAIQDIQVYTDGAPAEFGEFSGMTVNIVTKDGGDEHHGSIGDWYGMDASFQKTYLIADLEQHIETQQRKQDFWNDSLSLTAGGPLVKEKLWYFVAADLAHDNHVYEGQDPDHPLISNGGQGLFKLSFFPTPDITLRNTVNLDGSFINNYETSSLFDPSSQDRYTNTTVADLLSLDWRPNANTQFGVRGGVNITHLNIKPMSDDEATPAILNTDTSQITNNYTEYDLNTRNRYGGALDFTRLLNNVAGNHKFKTGADLWYRASIRELIQTGPDGTDYDADGNPISYQGRKYLADANHPCTAPDYLDCAGYYDYQDSGALPQTGRTIGAYIQDDWNLVDPLTLNLGVRFDNERLFNNEGDSVMLGQDDPDTPDDERTPLNEMMWSPRLGLAWDVTNDSKTLVSGFAGRYYDISNFDFSGWANTRSDAYFSIYYMNDATGTYDFYYTQDPTLQPLIYGQPVDCKDPDVIATCDAYGDYTLRVPHMDKVTLGVEREIIPLLAVGLRGIASKTVDLTEDKDFDLQNWYIINPESKRRDYRALELTVEKKYDDVWQLLSSLTLSESQGTNPGQFETATGESWGSDGNNVGVYLDDVNDRDTRAYYFDLGYGYFLDGLSGLGTESNTSGWYGYLPYHSFWQGKINGSYTAPWGSTIGLVYEFDSGHAWQKRCYVSLYADYDGFCQGRGTRFMPAVNYIDFRIAHKFDLSKDKSNTQSIEASLDIFNLPDLKQAIWYDENDDENFGLTISRQAPRSVRLGLKATY